MAVTLAQAKLNVQDALQAGVIDEFIKSNYMWEHIQFDDAVSPVGGGATLTYSYNRVKTQGKADFRLVNEEYAPQEVDKEQKSVNLAIFGGSFKIDRVIANMGGIANEVTFQMQQKIKAASALWNDTVINGDTGTNNKAFDGLEKALTGSSTENKPGTAIDLSNSEAVGKNYMAFFDSLDETLAEMDGTPSALLMNGALYVKFLSALRRAAAYTETKDSVGRSVFTYNGIPLVNLGAKSGSNDPVVPIKETENTTSLYAVRFGLDGFHAVSMAGVAPVQTWLPDFKTAGAVKPGEVEMVAAVALKATKAAAVLRNIKVK